MDEFFSGLDSRLRMSVKVADSIMMGLVNAAMEDAYKKSLWKDGDLERLFQKLRFAELAIMQLEWCLRFVRGEIEADGGADDNHEQLLDDLLETRDRIQVRLDEAELAVADKDRDYMRRKHEELSSSRRETAPTDSEYAVAGHGEEDCAFAELKGSVDRQMARMRFRLEDARSTLAVLMQKVSGEASPMARLQEAGHEGDGVKGLSGFYSMAQLLMEFQEMVLDASAVRDSVTSSFDVMERSLSSLTATIDEQQWLANAEKDMYGAVVEGFLREINVDSPVLKNGSSSPGEGNQSPTENTWEETESLKDVTEQLQSTRRIPETISDRAQCCHSEEPGVSHEEVKRLIEEKIDSEIKCGLQDVLYASMFRDLVRKLAVQEEAQKLTAEKDELDIRSRLQCEIYATIFKDLASKLVVESAEHLIRTLIKDEVHTFLVAKTLNEWKSTTEMVCNENLIKEEIDCVVFGGLTKDLAQKHSLNVLKYPDEIKGSNYLGRFSIIDNFEQLQKMKTQINVTNEDKGVDYNKHQVPVKQEILSSSDYCNGEDSKESGLQAETSTDKDDVSDSVNGNAEQALEQQDHRKLHTGDVPLSLSMPPEGANLKNGPVALTLDEKYGTRHSLASNAIIGKHDKFELQSALISFTNFQKIFMDFEAVTGEKIGTAMLRFVSFSSVIFHAIRQLEDSLKIALELRLPAAADMQFSNVRDRAITVYLRSLYRLRDLDEHLANLVEQVSSLKRSELIHRRAFTKRCHDLQTAETEVDLLGDEVELLLGLLSKTYKALDHYSPVLQHYLGIREMLTLLGKELAVRHQVH